MDCLKHTLSFLQPLSHFANKQKHLENFALALFHLIFVNPMWQYDANNDNTKLKEEHLIKIKLYKDI